MKKFIEIFITDLILYFIQIIIFTLCYFFIAPGFINMERFEKFLSGRISELTLAELCFTFYGTTIFATILYYIHTLLPNNFLKNLLRQIIDEYPKIIYLLGANLSAPFIALAYGIYIGKINEPPYTALSTLQESLFFAIIFFLYGLAFRYFTLDIIKNC